MLKSHVKSQVSPAPLKKLFVLKAIFYNSIVWGKKAIGRGSGR